MRDKVKDENYFDLRITDLYEGITTYFDWIEKGITPKERINIVKRAIVGDYISVINCKYSKGLDKIYLIDDLVKAINITFESWNGFWKLRQLNGEELNQYVLSAYDEMLWMLSLGFLLEVPEAEFNKLVYIIDRDGIKDYLFEFIIRAKIESHLFIKCESYKNIFSIPEIFSTLRLAINENDNSRAQILINEYITKHWYNGHRDAGWHNSHKSKHATYSGYWSYETAAIVKIMKLDDQSFRTVSFYPKDLAD